jgi:hypothetical protein
MVVPGKDVPTKSTLERVFSNPGFRIHAMVFAAVMILLAGLDWWTAEPYWVHWVLLGWGAGLIGHGWLALRGGGGTAV